MTRIKCPTIEIKQLEPLHFREATEFLYLNWKEMYQNYRDYSQSIDLNFFVELIDNKKTPIWAAFTKNKMIGVMITLSNCIDFLMVDKQYRQKNIGSRFVDEANHYFKLKRYQHMQVGIEDFNEEGHAFFSSLGWKHIGTEHIDVSPHQTVEAFVYSKRVK